MNTDDVIGLLKNTRKSKPKYSNLMPMGITKGYTLNDIRVTVLSESVKFIYWMLFTQLSVSIAKLRDQKGR